MSLGRTTALAVLAGAGAAVAVRLPPLGPWAIAACAVGAGTLLAILSTRRPDAIAVPAGALGGVLLVAVPHPWIAGAAFALVAWLPRARRAGSAWDAALVLAFSAAGGAVAAPLAAFSPSPALGAAAALLAGVALASASFVPESTGEALALRRSARGLPASANEALRRAAALSDRIARSEAPTALKDRAREAAAALAEDGRTLFRLGEVRGASRALDERREDLCARCVRMAGVLERAWVTGELPPEAARLRVVEELEEEAEATERAAEAVARLVR